MKAIISDIHANLAALEAVIADIDRQGISDILCLGDIVGYNAQPDECISLIRERNIPFLLGNHDSYITTGKNCERSEVVAGIINDHREMLSDESINWLDTGKEKFVYGTDIFFHGGPQDPMDQYIYEVNEATFPKNVLRMFVGHTHVQTVIKIGEKVFCNPGSVGQPRDGDPRAAYATITHDEVICHRVDYDVERTIRAMQERNYEAFKYYGLRTGTQIGGRQSEIITV
ncbi:metallophosphoesterase family protein [Lentilitoribacter sp. EG35]|uniref:metallophosphoesterase family protein n=1 Tax=Lentilitoribacter sp. EG35 TaxID=3234192 RepID=UPI0034606374